MRTPAAQAVLEATELLEALRPFQDTERSTALMKSAWDKAWGELESALKAWGAVAGDA